MNEHGDLSVLNTNEGLIWEDIIEGYKLLIVPIGNAQNYINEIIKINQSTILKDVGLKNVILGVINSIKGLGEDIDTALTTIGDRKGFPNDDYDGQMLMFDQLNELSRLKDTATIVLNNNISLIESTLGIEKGISGVYV